MEAVAWQDPRDFQRVFDDLYPQSHALALRILRDAAAAEAVATEALARTYARWPKVRKLPHPDGWVLRLTGNLATTSLSRFTDTPSALSQALAELPDEQREPVVLRFLTELEDADVSLVLGIAEDDVRARLREGLLALKARLSAEDLAGV
jgi:DNA-directed RNA polymerase specialized sigma24 family protein